MNLTELACTPEIVSSAHGTMCSNKELIHEMQRASDCFQMMNESQCMGTIPLLREGLGFGELIYTKADILGSLGHDFEHFNRNSSDEIKNVQLQESNKEEQRFKSFLHATNNTNLQKGIELSNLSAELSSNMRQFFSATRALQRKCITDVLDYMCQQEHLRKEVFLLLNQLIESEEQIRAFLEGQWEVSCSCAIRYWYTLHNAEVEYNTYVLRKSELMERERLYASKYIESYYAEHRDFFQKGLKNAMSSYSELKKIITRFHFPVGDVNRVKSEPGILM